MCVTHDTPRIRPYEYINRDGKIIVSISGASIEASQIASIYCTKAIEKNKCSKEQIRVVINVAILRLVGSGILADSGRFVNINRLIKLGSEILND
jgi:hypothetical protein